jgi:sphingolipid 4-desaturase/C4-monooxygenase
MNATDPHHARSQAILKEFPEIRQLFHPEPLTFVYFLIVAGLSLSLMYIASQGSWLLSILLGVTLGPYIDAMILVLIHEVSHNRASGNIRIDRWMGILINIFMLAPISEIFRQHHNKHHLMLGDMEGDVDVPLEMEVDFVGNSAIKKALWLIFNMVILPIRSLYKLEVKTNFYVVANFVLCLGFTIALAFFNLKVFICLGLSLLCSQGLHPANARQLQRHLWDSSDEKAFSAPNTASMTYSFYGLSNLLFLNVGYHIEHHDFVQVPWTKLPQVRKIAGEKWYPESQAYTSRGWGDLVNFVFNDKVTLANFYSNTRSKHRMVGSDPMPPKKID